MRKRACMGVMLSMLIIVMLGYLMVLGTSRVFLQIEGETPCISVCTAQSENKIMLWQNDLGGGRITFSFLPM